MSEKVFTEEEIEAGLLACADGLLDDDPELQAAVDARMEADPVARARVESWTAINAAIRTAHATIAAEAVPPRLRAAFGPKPRHHLTRRAIYATSVVAAALALGFIAGREVGMRMHMPATSDTATVAAPRPSAAPSVTNPDAVTTPATVPAMPALDMVPRDRPQPVPYQAPAARPTGPQGS
jgi:anti-sigma factor RsiW